MTTYRRSGFKWSINELLSLQREYELLEWTVQQIAEKHERSVEAILFRLEDEGFIDSWNSARGYNQINYQNAIEGGDSLESNCEDNEVVNENVDEDEDEDSEANVEEKVDMSDIEEPSKSSGDVAYTYDVYDNIQVLTDRVSSMENSISELKNMMQIMMEKIISPKTAVLTDIKFSSANMNPLNYNPGGYAYSS